MKCLNVYAYSHKTSSNSVEAMNFLQILEAIYFYHALYVVSHNKLSAFKIVNMLSYEYPCVDFWVLITVNVGEK